MQFVDPRHGFLAMLHEAPATDIMTPYFYRTGDGGRTWSVHVLPSDAVISTTVGTSGAFDFVDPRNGWMLARLTAATGGQTSVEIDRTQNGGASWKAVARGEFGRGKSFGGLTTEGSFSSIKFQSKHFGWVFGTMETGGFYAYVTNQTGAHWRRGKIVAPQQRCAKGPSQVSNYEPLSAGWVAGRTWLLPIRVSLICGRSETSYFVVYRLTSGKATWTDPVRLPYPVNPPSATYGAPSPLLAPVTWRVWYFAAQDLPKKTGFRSLHGNVMARTDGGGRRWQGYPLHLPTGAQPSDLVMFGLGRGYILLSHLVVAPYENNILPYRLESTSNGGRTWSQVRLPSG